MNDEKDDTSAAAPRKRVVVGATKQRIQVVKPSRKTSLTTKDLGNALGAAEIIPIKGERK